MEAQTIKSPVTVKNLSGIRKETGSGLRMNKELLDPPSGGGDGECKRKL